MATEIVTLKLVDSFTPELCERSAAFFTPPPSGFLSHKWTLTHEPNTIIWLLNWESVEAHVNFMNSAIYATFVGTVKEFCAGPITLYHTHLQPFPPDEIFECGEVLIASALKKPGVAHEEVDAVRDRALASLSVTPGVQCLFHGVKHEDPNVYILIIGWESDSSLDLVHELWKKSRHLFSDDDLIIHHLTFRR